MADVHVNVTNKTGGKTSLLLDEDDPQIDYFKKLVKRDELDAVSVSKPKSKPASATPAS